MWTLNSQNSLEQEEHNQRAHISRFQNLLQDSVVLAQTYLQINEIEVASKKAYIYDQLIVDQDAKTIRWGKQQSFQHRVLGRLESQED